MSAEVDVLPTYEQATRSQSSTASPYLEDDDDNAEHNGIPLRTRRSMEDELRPLPERWVRTYDPATQHQFFVDTVSAPPRAVWNHPYDDDVYMSTLSQSERDAIHASFPNDPLAEPVIPDDEVHPDSSSRFQTKNDENHRSLAHKIKNSLTGHHHHHVGSTHPDLLNSYPGSSQASQRNADHDAPALSPIPLSEEQQHLEAQEEREMHRQHLLLRNGMSAAMDTSKPQLLGRDQDGTDVYLEPPGHMFPGVDTGRVKPLSPYLNEVFYENDDSSSTKGAEQRHFPGPKGRYLRPRGEMYGFGYGGYDCGEWGGGRWPKPRGEPEEGRRRKKGPVGPGEEGTRHGHAGFRGGMALPMMAPLFGGLILGSLMF